MGAVSGGLARESLGTANLIHASDIPHSIVVERDEEDERELLAGGADTRWAKSRFSVSFGDVAASEYNELVDETVDLVKHFPGVTDAIRDDRELIVLLGDFDPKALEQHIRAWWLEQLKGEV